MLKATDNDVGKFADIEFSQVGGVAKLHIHKSAKLDYKDIVTVTSDGQVILKSDDSNDFDAEKYEYIEVDVKAEDDPKNTAAHASSTETLRIYLVDVNDHAPKFSPDMSRKVSISEGLAVGDIIDIEISAADDDYSPNESKVGYKVVGNPPFKFDGDKLVVNGPLDFESKDRYEIEIEAFNPDSKNHDLKTLTTLTILIENKNESPVCQKKLENSNIAIENLAPIGTSVGEMSCNDGDSNLQPLGFTMQPCGVINSVGLRVPWMGE